MMIISFFIGLVLSILLGFIYIPFLKKLKCSQSVSKHLNRNHLAKNGTPTMGGLIFVSSTLIASLLLLKIKIIALNYSFLLVLFVFIFYSLIGYIDDYLKISQKNNKGISITTKFLFQLIIAIIFFVIFLILGNNTVVDFFVFHIDLKWLYGMFILFLFSGSSNAVNITDGLDGLAAGCCMISFWAYGIIALNSPYIIGYREISIFCFVLSGSLFGFLLFNFYPAKVFMGDLGSLALGSTLAAIAVILKVEMSLVFIGFVYIIETISSFVQIVSIRYFHKKVFKKAPLHHHFEEYHLKETEIVKIFYLVNAIFSLSYIIYYLWII